MSAPMSHDRENWLRVAKERDEIKAERDQLRAERDWLKTWQDQAETNYVIGEPLAKKLRDTMTFQQERNSRLFEQRNAAVAAQEKAEAELAAERARLDWLEDHGWVTGEPCDRAGIDAAMKEGAK